MIGCLQTCVHKQPIIVFYFEFETVLKFYNLGSWSVTENVHNPWATWYIWIKFCILIPAIGMLNGDEASPSIISAVKVFKWKCLLLLNHTVCVYQILHT